jgi:hypothetical protein
MFTTQVDVALILIVHLIPRAIDPQTDRRIHESEVQECASIPTRLYEIVETASRDSRATHYAELYRAVRYFLRGRPSAGEKYEPQYRGASKNTLHKFLTFLCEGHVRDYETRVACVSKAKTKPHFLAL